jgi:DNA-binding IclR family transcriptional regulator
MTAEPGGAGDGVLDRAVRLLEAFGPRVPSLTIGELSRRAGLPLSTTSRLVAELVRHGLLARDPQTRQVRVGLHLWELGSRAAPTRGLREAALPFMEDLHSAIPHHVQLGVLDGTDVIFLERLSARDAVVNVTEVGGRLPVHASSAGLVLLAHAGVEVLDQVLSRPLTRYTPATITSPQRLRSTLAGIRQAGFAHTPGHLREAAAGVAAPVRGPQDSVIAALGVVVPNDAAAVRTVPALLAAARGIRRSMSRG